MAAVTNKQKTLDGLAALGYEEVAATSKYRKFRVADRQFYFVGKSGALRKGATASASLSLTDSRLHRAIRSIGLRKGNFTSPHQAWNTLSEMLRAS